jgi:hypothetical protein
MENTTKSVKYIELKHSCSRQIFVPLKLNILLAITMTCSHDLDFVRCVDSSHSTLIHGSLADLVLQVQKYGTVYHTR